MNSPDTTRPADSNAQPSSRWSPGFIAALLSGFVCGVIACSGQSRVDESKQNSDKQINVNWLYGSYVPKEVPLESLTARGRWNLYTRQTYTTWGIYIKSSFFAVSDQRHDSFPQWGDGFGGFAKRWGSRQGQFILQNSAISLGDGVLGWEPRYDRCRCENSGRRVLHAVLRNFVTYDRRGSLRPQIFTYVGAFGGSTIATVWEPGKVNWQVKGYQAAVTQVPVGIGINFIGEFAPEIGKLLHVKGVFDR